MAETVVKVCYGDLMSYPDLSRVLACLHEKNVKIEVISTRNGRHHVPLNIVKLQEEPSGRVRGPAFNDRSENLFGSRVICRYLSENEKYAGKGNKYLLGSGSLERASIEEWLRSEEHSFDPTSWTLVFHMAFPNFMNLEPNRVLIQESERKMCEILDVYNQRLADSKFLAGNKFTLADLVHLPNSYYLANSKEWSYLFTSRKHVKKWWKEISERESWRNTVMALDEMPTLIAGVSYKGIVPHKPEDFSAKLVELPCDASSSKQDPFSPPVLEVCDHHESKPRSTVPKHLIFQPCERQSDLYPRKIALSFPESPQEPIPYKLEDSQPPRAEHKGRKRSPLPADVAPHEPTETETLRCYNIPVASSLHEEVHQSEEKPIQRSKRPMPLQPELFLPSKPTLGTNMEEPHLNHINKKLNFTSEDSVPTPPSLPRKQDTMMAETTYKSNYGKHTSKVEIQDSYESTLSKPLSRLGTPIPSHKHIDESTRVTSMQVQFSQQAPSDTATYNQTTESEIPSQAAHVPPRTETLQPSKPPEMSQFSKPIHPQLSVLEGYYLAQTHQEKLHKTKDPQQDQEPRNATPQQKPAQGNIKHEVDRPGYPTPRQQVHQFQQMPSESQIHKLENPISSMQHKENISSTTPVELASTDPRFPPPMVQDSFAQPSQQPIDLSLQESESNRNKIQSDGTYYKEKSSQPSQAHFENFTGVTHKSEAHDSQLETPSQDLQASQKNNGESIPESYPPNGASSKPPRVLPRPLESKGQPLAIQPPEPQADAPYRNPKDTEFAPYVNKKKNDFRSEDSLPTYSNLLKPEDSKIPKAASHSSHQKPPDPFKSEKREGQPTSAMIPSPTLEDEANQPFESPIESIEMLSDNKEVPIAPSILGLNTQQKLSQSYKDRPDAQDNKISPEPLQVSRKKNENEKTPPIHLYTPQDEMSQFSKPIHPQLSVLEETHSRVPTEETHSRELLSTAQPSKKEQPPFIDTKLDDDKISEPPRNTSIVNPEETQSKVPTEETQIREPLSTAQPSRKEQPPFLDTKPEDDQLIEPPPNTSIVNPDETQSTAPTEEKDSHNGPSDGMQSQMEETHTLPQQELHPKDDSTSIPSDDMQQHTFAPSDDKFKSTDSTSVRYKEPLDPTKETKSTDGKVQTQENETFSTGQPSQPKEQPPSLETKPEDDKFSEPAPNTSIVNPEKIQSRVPTEETQSREPLSMDQPSRKEQTTFLETKSENEEFREPPHNTSIVNPEETQSRAPTEETQLREPFITAQPSQKEQPPFLYKKPEDDKQTEPPPNTPTVTPEETQSKAPTEEIQYREPLSTPQPPQKEQPPFLDTNPEDDKFIEPPPNTPIVNPEEIQSRVPTEETQSRELLNTAQHSQKDQTTFLETKSENEEFREPPPNTSIVNPEETRSRAPTKETQSREPFITGQPSQKEQPPFMYKEPEDDKQTEPSPNTSTVTPEETQSRTPTEEKDSHDGPSSGMQSQKKETHTLPQQELHPKDDSTGIPSDHMQQHTLAPSDDKVKSTDITSVRYKEPHDPTKQKESTDKKVQTQENETLNTGQPSHQKEQPPFLETKPEDDEFSKPPSNMSVVNPQEKQSKAPTKETQSREPLSMDQPSRKEQPPFLVTKPEDDQLIEPPPNTSIVNPDETQSTAPTEEKDSHNGPSAGMQSQMEETHTLPQQELHPKDDSTSIPSDDMQQHTFAPSDDKFKSTDSTSVRYKEPLDPTKETKSTDGKVQTQENETFSTGQPSQPKEQPPSLETKPQYEKFSEPAPNTSIVNPEKIQSSVPTQETKSRELLSTAQHSEKEQTTFLETQLEPPSLLPKRLESEAQVTHQSKDIQAQKGKPNLSEPNSEDTEFFPYIKKKKEDFRLENSVQTPNLPQSSDPMIFGSIEKQVPRTQFEARNEFRTPIQDLKASQEITTPHSTLIPTTKKKSPPKEKTNHLDVKPEPFKPEKREGQPTSAMIPSPTLEDEANQPFESPIESIDMLSDNKEAPIAPSILSLNTQQKLSQSYKDQPDAQDNKISPEPLQVSRKKNENEKNPPIHLYTPQDENNQAPRTGSSLEKSKLSSSEQTSPKGTSTSSTKKQMTQPSYTPEIPTLPFPRDPFGQSPNKQSQVEVLFKGEVPKPFEQALNSPLERKPSSGESPFQQGQTKVPLKGTPSKPFEQASIPSKETLTSSDMEQTPRSASQLKTPIQTPPSPKKPVGQSAGQQAQAEMPLKEEASEPFEQAFISPNQRSEDVRNPEEKSRGKNDTSLLQSDLIPKARQEIATYSRKTGDPTNIRQVSAERPQMPEGNGEDGSSPKSPKPLQESITRKEGEQLHEPFPSLTPKNEANQPSKPQTESNHSYPEQDSTMGKLHTPSMAQGPVPTSQPELLERTKPSPQKPVGHSLSEQAQAEVHFKQEMVKPFEQAQEPETQKEVQKPERKFAIKSDISDSQPNFISNTQQETSPSSRKSSDQADIKQMPPKKQQEPEEKKDADTVD